jgi:choline dehydrogenase-like flavoprotein
MPYSLGPDAIDLIQDATLDPRAWTSILSHLFGGCVMGADPQHAVCGPNGRVFGYKRLIISDASAIPTTLGVNPQHTIMALSRMRAHELLDAES